MSASQALNPESAAVMSIPARAERDDFHAIRALLDREPFDSFPQIDHVAVGQSMAPGAPVELHMFSLTGSIPDAALKLARQIVHDATGTEATVATFGPPNGSP